MRVTAGGRVVPSDLPPLSTSRFGTSNLRASSSRVVSPSNFTSGFPGTDTSDAKLPNPSQGLFAQNNQAYLFIDNQLVPINNAIPMNNPYHSGQNGSSSASTRPFGEPNSLPVPATMPPYLAQPRPQAGVSAPSASLLHTSPTFPPTDLAALKQQHAAKKQELKTLEQIEVLEAPRQNDVWRSMTIEKKRALIVEIDALRRSVMAAEGEAARTAGSAQSGSLGPTSATLAPPFQQPMISPMYHSIGLPPVPFGVPTFQQNFAQQPMLMYGAFGNPPVLGTDAQLPSTFGLAENGVVAGSFPHTIMPVQPGDIVKPAVGRENQGQSPTGPASPTRRSHAVEIKPPKDEPKPNETKGSTLNPRSPTYEPAKPTFDKNAQTSGTFGQPTPSPRATAEQVFQRSSVESLKNGQQTLKQKPSFSSVSTADFFPMNTHEHSLTKTAPPDGAGSKQPSRENLRNPTTPEKQWGTGLWNPVSRSGGKCTMSQWLSSPDHVAIWSTQYINSPAGPRRMGRTTDESTEMSRGSPNPSAMGSGTDKNWFLTAPVGANNVPSTYQEGYQAGCTHTGLPRNIEVLRGYHDGLKEVLASLNSSSSSSRGTPFIMTPQDSGIGMAFGSGNTSSNAGQENTRRPPTLPAPPTGNLQSGSHSGRWTAEQAVKYVLCNETAGLPRPGARTGKTDSLEMVHEDRVMGRIPSDSGTQLPQENVRIQMGPPMSGMPPPRQYSGNQLGLRGMESPYRKQQSSDRKQETPFASMTPVSPTSTRPARDQRYSGFDGAFDDLVEIEPSIKGAADDYSGEASCFTSYGKGKQKATGSPTKSPGSPKKSGEVSPAKAKLEQLANNLKGRKGAEPKNMSHEEKQHWRENWRKRFSNIRQDEARYVQKVRQQQDEQLRTQHRKQGQGVQQRVAQQQDGQRASGQRVGQREPFVS